MRPELLFVTGLDHAAVERVIRAMCRFDDTSGVAYNVRAAAFGAIHRWLRRGGTERIESMEVAPHRVLPVVRDALRRAVAELATDAGVRRIVVPLDPALEPGPVCQDLLGPAGADTDIAQLVEVRGVLTVVDEPTWLADATGAATLAERGFAVGPADTRTVAQVAVGQVESADAIVLAGHSDLPTALRNAEVLNRLAPMARRRRGSLDEDSGWMLADAPGGATNARTPFDAHGPLLRGEPVLYQGGGVGWLLFSSPLPMHPGRLHDLVPDLLDGAVRTRGRVWLPGRPDDIMWLESAGGGLRVERAGTWLAASDAAVADAQRTAFASLRWHPRFGDRSQEIAVLAHSDRGLEIASRLRLALLSGPELAGGPAAWRRLPDPFGVAHTDPCDDIHHHLAGTSAPHALHLRG